MVETHSQYAEAMKPNPYEHLSGEQLDTMLDLIEAQVRVFGATRRPTPFDLLLRGIYQSQCEFIHTNGKRPTTVFLGSSQMEAFTYAPPRSTTSEQDARAMRSEQTVEGLEVVRVLKDSFLQVA